MNNNRFLTKKEVADFLGVTVYTIDRYQRDRGMPYYRVGTEPRYLPADIIEWMQQFKNKKIEFKNKKISSNSE